MIKTVSSTKNTLLDGKRSSGTLKRKYISFLNDIVSLFKIPSDIASLAIQQGVIVPCDRLVKRPIRAVFSFSGGNR